MHLIPEPRSKALTICFAVLVSFVCFSRLSAATLADYRHRVSESIAAIKQLSADGDEGLSPQEQFVMTTAARIRELLPVKETVLLDGQSVMVDNTWLHEALQDYENANSTAAQRAATRARIEERLRSLDERLDEMQRPKTANTGDKDENKGRLAEILRRPDYNKTVDEGSALERWWTRFSQRM